MLDNMTVNQDGQVISLEDRETTPTWPVSINTTPLAGIWLASRTTSRVATPSLSKVDGYSYCKSRLVRPSKGDPSLGGHVPDIAVGRVASDHRSVNDSADRKARQSGLDGPGSTQSGLRLIATGGRPMRQVSSCTKPIRCPLPSGDGQRHPWTDAKVDTKNPERGPLLILREACDPAECPGRRNWH